VQIHRQHTSWCSKLTALPDHFTRYAPEHIEYGVNRYQNETRRLYGVLDKHLASNNRPYLCGEKCTIAGQYSFAMSDFPPLYTLRLLKTAIRSKATRVKVLDSLALQQYFNNSSFPHSYPSQPPLKHPRSLPLRMGCSRWLGWRRN
jgi:glutathione S-transferase